MALYHRIRPKTLDDIYGNETLITVVKSILERSERPHAYFITGPYGSGKTTTARIIANMFGATEKNKCLQEINCSDFNGIGTIRKIRTDSGFKSLTGNTKVFLIDEMHELSKAAQDGILKQLEDPQPNTVFILCTTEPTKILPTIKSRCMLLKTEILSDKDMRSLILSTCMHEDIDIPETCLHKIIEVAEGHSRDAINLLESIMTLNDEKMMMNVLDMPEKKKEEIINLCRIMMKKSSWKQVAEVLNGLKYEDPEAIRRVVLGYCTTCLLRGNPKAAVIMEEFKAPFFYNGFPIVVYACYSALHG